jgi:uncharacterized membrane protein
MIIAEKAIVYHYEDPPKTVSIIVVVVDVVVMWHLTKLHIWFGSTLIIHHGCVQSSQPTTLYQHGDKNRDD